MACRMGPLHLLPNPPLPKDWMPQSRAFSEYAAPRRKRLLVVEDDPAQQLSIEALLGYDDIEVEFVPTGADAIAAIEEHAFDCLVLDLRLPDMTGFEASGTT